MAVSGRKYYEKKNNDIWSRISRSKIECTKEHEWFQIGPYKFQCDNCEKIECQS